MKAILYLFTFLFSTGIMAQDLPKKSSHVEVEQKVGLTELEIEYSRPNVNGRTVFGDIVPFGEVWRLGANAATTIELDFPISINGQVLDTGKYAMFAIPNKNNWKIVFNTEAEQWGSNGYDEKKNVLEYNAAVSNCAHTESFTISFENVTENDALMSFQWASIKVSVPFSTDTRKAVEASISAAIEKGEDLARVYYNAADYALDEEKNEKAMELINKSISIERAYYNVFLLAQMKKDTDVKAAKKLGSEAADLAVKAEKQRWADYINRTIGEW